LGGFGRLVCVSAFQRQPLWTLFRDSPLANVDNFSEERSVATEENANVVSMGLAYVEIRVVTNFHREMVLDMLLVQYGLPLQRNIVAEKMRKPGIFPKKLLQMRTNFLMSALAQSCKGVQGLFVEGNVK
jgi:hypothetical protein